MFKNAVIVILSIVVMLYWLSEKPEDTISDDPNDVVIEYKCNELQDYEHVPLEVLKECQKRGLLKNTI